jgi:hypothetical protein
VSDIVREFFPAPPQVSAAGPIVGSRILRSQMRQAMGAFTSIGVPVSRLGLMLEFVSGVYGRNGLRPASAWFDYVKLNALAARQVAREMGLPTIWSWGWATYTEKSAFDADKQSRCLRLPVDSQPERRDGPGGRLRLRHVPDPRTAPAAAAGFLPLGTAGVIATATRAALAGVTHDPEAATSIAFEWAAARAASRLAETRSRRPSGR